MYRSSLEWLLETMCRVLLLRFTDYSATLFYALCAILCLGNFLHVQALAPNGELLMERKTVQDFLFSYHLEMARQYESEKKQMPRSCEGGDKPHPYVGRVLQSRW